MYISQPLSTPLDQLFAQYRNQVMVFLSPLVLENYPDLHRHKLEEFQKMMELTAKMTVVGHACSEIAGFPFDERRQHIAMLYGACCFLADSFIDDFGQEVAEEYIERMELLLSKGWFDICTEREKLFYVIIARLFAERNVLDPLLRQAIMRLFQAQKRDVIFRANPEQLSSLTRREQLRLLQETARNRSGHAILVLTGFLVPEVPLSLIPSIYLAGSLIMHIDDHGDCYSDLHYRRLTYLNQVADPERTLRRIYRRNMTRLWEELPAGGGRDLLVAFLAKYFRTRLRKHRLQKAHRELAWAVYE